VSCLNILSCYQTLLWYVTQLEIYMLSKAVLISNSVLYYSLPIILLYYNLATEEEASF
jgi:hypothetical protein